MSDLFRHDPPRMSDDEDRRAWERVRTAVAPPAPWWAALWARPAVRFGLPAVAVVLVAVVWIAVEQPASTHRPAQPVVALDAARDEARDKASTGAPEAAAPAAPPAPAPARMLATPPAGLRKKAVDAPVATRSVREADAKDMRDMAAAPIAVKEEKVAAAPAPAKPIATTHAVNGLVPSNLAPTAGATFGAMKQSYRGDSDGVAGARGGRADELTAGAASATSALDAVGPLLATRPLFFSAPLPVSPGAGAAAPERVSIELGLEGGASARIVGAAAESGALESAARETYTRFEDARPAEQILLVACAADRMPKGAPPSLVQRLLAEARRLEAQGGGDEPAARALVARLQKKESGR